MKRMVNTLLRWYYIPYYLYAGTAARWLRMGNSGTCLHLAEYIIHSYAFSEIKSVARANT